MSLPHIHNYVYLHPCIITITFILSLHTWIETLWYFWSTLHKPCVFYLLVSIFSQLGYGLLNTSSIFINLSSHQNSSEINKCPMTWSIIYYISYNHFQCLFQINVHQNGGKKMRKDVEMLLFYSDVLKCHDTQIVKRIWFRQHSKMQNNIFDKLFITPYLLFIVPYAT